MKSPAISLSLRRMTTCAPWVSSSTSRQIRGKPLVVAQAMPLTLVDFLLSSTSRLLGFPMSLPSTFQGSRPPRPPPRHEGSPSRSATTLGRVWYDGLCWLGLLGTCCHLLCHGVWLGSYQHPIEEGVQADASLGETLLDRREMALHIGVIHDDDFLGFVRVVCRIVLLVLALRRGLHTIFDRC